MKGEDNIVRDPLDGRNTHYPDPETAVAHIEQDIELLLNQMQWARRFLE